MSERLEPIRHPARCAVCSRRMRVGKCNPGRQLCCGRADCVRELGRRRQQRSRERRLAAMPLAEKLAGVRRASASSARSRHRRRQRQHPPEPVALVTCAVLGLLARFFQTDSSAVAQRLFADHAETGRRFCPGLVAPS